MAIDIDEPIPWGTVEDAISDWVTAVVGLTTHWADQAAPQPARPFVLLSIEGPVEIGTGDEKRTVEILDGAGAGTDDWQEQTIGQREITITVQVEVDKASSQSPAVHARAQATRLFSSLTIDTLTAGLEAAGLAYRARNPILDLSISIADEFVGRAAFDYRAGLASCVVEDIDVIERVTGEGEASRPDGTTRTVTIDIASTP